MFRMKPKKPFQQFLSFFFFFEHSVSDFLVSFSLYSNLLRSEQHDRETMCSKIN